MSVISLIGQRYLSGRIQKRRLVSTLKFLFSTIIVIAAIGLSIAYTTSPIALGSGILLVCLAILCIYKPSDLLLTLLITLFSGLIIIAGIVTIVTSLPTLSTTSILALLFVVLSVFTAIYLLIRLQVNMITIISAISITGIYIGVAALIVVLSVFNGFNTFAIKQLVGFDPHLRITSTVASTFDANALIPTLEIPDMVSATPFIQGRAAISYKGISQVPEIRGIQRDAVPTNGNAYPPLDLQALNSEGSPIILGSLVANQLRVGIGDQISIISRQGLELALTQVAQPVTIPATVVGTFSLNQEYDAHVAFTDLQTARELFDLPTGEMGIEIRLQNYEFAEEIALDLSQTLGSDYRVETWQDLHRDLYGAMQLERWAAFAILLLIVIVAVFNVLGSLTMTVIEKQRDIGVLKAMGASDRGILRIFLYEGGLVGVIGTIIGVLLGIGICLLQQEIGFYKLDTASYLLPALPVEMHIWDILLVMLISLTLATVAAIYPAKRAAKINSADAVRWE